MVVIPALNEASCIAATVESWLALRVAKVRVIDNGSTDDTAAIARASGAEVVAEPQRGYGAAAWRGLQNWPADVTWVIFSSADGSDHLNASEIDSWQAAIDAGADLVVGDRVSNVDARAELKWIQRVGNWIVCEAIRYGWNARFADMGSLRLMRHSALMRLNLADRGFGWNVEMQVRAIEQSWKIVEIPVRSFPRLAGPSKISGTLSGTIRAAKAMIGMLLFLWMLRRQARARRQNSSLPAGT